jgi:hypothetical protein
MSTERSRHSQWLDIPSTFRSVSHLFAIRHAVNRGQQVSAIDDFRQNHFSWSHFYRSVILSTCAIALFEHRIALLVFSIRDICRPSTIIWLPSVLIQDILVFAFIYLFFQVPSRLSRLGPNIVFYRPLAILLSIFVTVVITADTLFLIVTGEMPLFSTNIRPQC